MNLSESEKKVSLFGSIESVRHGVMAAEEVVATHFLPLSEWLWLFSIGRSIIHPPSDAHMFRISNFAL